MHKVEIKVQASSRRELLIELRRQFLVIASKLWEHPATELEESDTDTNSSSWGYSWMVSSAKETWPPRTTDVWLPTYQRQGPTSE